MSNDDEDNDSNAKIQFKIIRAPLNLVEMKVENVFAKGKMPKSIPAIVISDCASTTRTHTQLILFNTSASCTTPIIIIIFSEISALLGWICSKFFRALSIAIAG